jgi:hypothetical protein
VGEEYDEDKVDDVVLALLYLTMFEDSFAERAWKSHDWDALAGYTRRDTSRTRRVRPSRWS